MKILVDIGHPAHVHYFRNLILRLKSNDHDIIVVARDKEVSHSLLNEYSINYMSRGRGGNGYLGKLVYLFSGVLKVFKIAKINKPDLFLSAGSMYAAIASKLCRRPHIALEDSENMEQIRVYRPFTDLILYPSSCRVNLGKKGVKIKGFLQSAYLKEPYFYPDPKIFEALSITKYSKYFLLRFVSLKASHDSDLPTTSISERIRLVNYLEKFGKVFISSESELPEELKKYLINIPPNKMLDAIYFSTAVIGESGAMTNEAAFLGVPSYLLLDPNLGVHYGYRDLGLKKIFQGATNEFYSDLDSLLNSGEQANEVNRRMAQKYHIESIDLVEFLEWIVLNSPKSLSNNFIRQSTWKNYVQ